MEYIKSNLRTHRRDEYSAACYSQKERVQSRIGELYKNRLYTVPQSVSIQQAPLLSGTAAHW